MSDEDSGTLEGPSNGLLLVSQAFGAVDNGEEVDFDSLRAQLTVEQDQTGAMGREVPGVDNIARLNAGLFIAVDYLEEGNLEAAKGAIRASLHVSMFGSESYNDREDEEDGPEDEGAIPRDVYLAMLKKLATLPEDERTSIVAALNSEVTRTEVRTEGPDFVLYIEGGESLRWQLED